MSSQEPVTASTTRPSFSELFTPKLVTVLREGYSLANFRADALAGLTVAIIALPLSMAIAIASGATPAQGLYTAIVGGFFVSALGGSRFQIGGPAGAFIVLVSATVLTHGIDGMILATMLSGLILAAIGFLRLGTYIKFIPYPVTVGFTAGIALIIFASQIGPLLGLALTSDMPGPALERLPLIWRALPTLDSVTTLLAVATLAVIALARKFRPHWPGMLIAVAGASAVSGLFDLPVATVGSEFGGIPSELPLPALPEITIEKITAVLPNAVSFALLGSIESLLSAVVADGMTGRRHRSNCELVAQGVANVASGLFGGMCVTGTIARTATNVRAGAHGPIAGILHAAFILLLVLVAAPLASYIPLASLAAVLAVVAWNMVEKNAIAVLVRTSRGDAAVMLSTLLLTIFRDLTEAIVVGFALGSVLFIHRMSKTTVVEAQRPMVEEDRSDSADGARAPYDERAATDPDLIVYRISGVLFFGAATSIGSVLDRIADTHRTLIVDFSAVPFLDSTAANTLVGLVRKASRGSVRVILTGTSKEVGDELQAHGLRPPLVEYAETIEQGTKLAKQQAKTESI
ncbi:MAG: SulP family inorganic anion transporter [Limibacillus sp.]|jgi:SulP family sulfate permease